MVKNVDQLQRTCKANDANMGFTIISSVTQMTRQGVGAVIFSHTHTLSQEKSFQDGYGKLK